MAQYYSIMSALPTSKSVDLDASEALQEVNRLKAELKPHLTARKQQAIHPGKQGWEEQDHSQ